MRIRVSWYFTNVPSFIKKIATIVRVCVGNSLSFTIVTNFQCAIATIVKYQQLFQCYRGTLQHLWLLDFTNQFVLNGKTEIFWMWRANRIARLNYWSINGSIHPDYMWSSLRQVLNSEMLAFSTTLAIQPFFIYFISIFLWHEYHNLADISLTCAQKLSYILHWKDNS